VRKFWFSNPSLLSKALLVTSVAITILLGVTGWLVQRYAVRTTSEGLEEEVRGSLRAYESMWRSRADMLASVSLVISNMSDVRAAFSTRDRATIQDTAGELWSKISHDDAIFLVTDPDGVVVASLAGAAPITNLPIVRSAAAKFPEQATGFMREGSELYQIVVTPVYVEAQHGEALLNVLVAGYPVTSSLVANLKQSTGSDFIYSAEGSTVVSTLDSITTAQLASSAEPSPASHLRQAGNAEYAMLTTPLIAVDGQRLGELRIVRSFDLARKRIAALRKNLLGIWIVAIGVGILLSYWLTRRIIDPIVRLNVAATAVAGHNYDFRVPVEGQDELGRLAVTFNSMCSSIQTARQELIRQERLATIGQLSTSIVHDLRNPLAAIYGGSEMLVDGDLAQVTVKRLAKNIYSASRRIQELLQDLVNTSRGKADSAEMCCLRDLISAACEPLLPVAQSQNTDIRIELPESLEAPVERARIERVFFNLCTNSLEALQAGGSIRISGAQQNGCALIRIEDTGPGIPKQIRERLFEPFSTAGKKNGLGLGLALSRQTVLAHGGDLWAEAVDHGASFCLRLPLRSRDRDAA
jgi:signal transduction histidine kinase